MAFLLGRLYAYREIRGNGSETRKTKSVWRGISRHFFRFSQHFVPGSAFTRKLKGFPGLFFHGINKTRNSHEMRKVYSVCFVFCGVFREKHLQTANGSV